MPKMTAKYEQALHTALQRAKIKPSQINQMTTQDDLYSALQHAGYFWDSAGKKWVYHAPTGAADPTPLIMVRVWADAEIVEEAADEVTERLVNFTLVERSTPYPCRPPKQLESRVYLKFMPKRT